MHPVEPKFAATIPAVHLVHAVLFDAVEYCPDAQAVHALAPAAGPVLVIEPAPHSKHAVTALEPVTFT